MLLTSKVTLFIQFEPKSLINAQQGIIQQSLFIKKIRLKLFKCLGFGVLSK